MTLRGRIALIAATAVAVAVAGASIAGYNSARKELIEEIDASLLERAEQFARFPMLAAFAGPESMPLLQLTDAFTDRLFGPAT